MLVCMGLFIWGVNGSWVVFGFVWCDLLWVEGCYFVLF